MKFDPKTGKLILPKRIEQDAEEREDIAVIDKSAEDETLPTCEFSCEKCANKVAYYWISQTRASDEPETKFMKCTKCGHIERDYS